MCIYYSSITIRIRPFFLPIEYFQALQGYIGEIWYELNLFGE